MKWQNRKRIVSCWNGCWNVANPRATAILTSSIEMNFKVAAVVHTNIWYHIKLSLLSFYWSIWTHANTQHISWRNKHRQKNHEHLILARCCPYPRLTVVLLFSLIDDDDMRFAVSALVWNYAACRCNGFIG